MQSLARIGASESPATFMLLSRRGCICQDRPSARRLRPVRMTAAPQIWGRRARRAQFSPSQLRHFFLRQQRNRPQGCICTFFDRLFPNQRFKIRPFPPRRGSRPVFSGIALRPPGPHGDHDASGRAAPMSPAPFSPPRTGLHAGVARGTGPDRRAEISAVL